MITSNISFRLINVNMANNTLKILVAGSVKGQYSKLFKRVFDINTKAGPFDLLLCVGDFFGNDYNAYDELINGSTNISTIPTYILGKMPKELFHYHPNVDNFDHGFELLDGITFLGKSGILTTSIGLRIAYLNGVYRNSNDNKESDNNDNYFTDDDYETLLLSCRNSSDLIIDLLLTTHWPDGIFNHVTIDETIQDKINESSSIKIAQLCNAIRPRYHFVSNIDYFYERQPFRHHRVINEASTNVTRFISLAHVANTKKMKWIYAFNIVPGRFLSAKELNTQPPGVTENPFRELLQNKQEQDMVEQGQSNQYRYDLSHSKNNNDGDYHRQIGKRKYMDDSKQQHRRPKKTLNVDVKECWFCLASPNVDKSLIISIGDYSYLALAKGGLTNDHMMILPIEHIRSSVEIENSELKEEIDKYKNALKQYYNQRSMVPVFYERNFRSVHFQIQVIGLPKTKIESLKPAAKEVFEKQELHEISIDDNIEDVVPIGIPYFYFECPEHYKFFVRINTKREFFPIQIGRELMAHKLLLNCPDRINWKNCANNINNDDDENDYNANASTADDDDDNDKKQSLDGQQILADKVRKSFKPFDFTI